MNWSERYAATAEDLQEKIRGFMLNNPNSERAVKNNPVARRCKSCDTLVAANELTDYGCLNCQVECDELESQIRQRR